MGEGDWIVRFLDLFCGAGGAAMGYYRAGFTDITGVDIEPMPRYPFKFVQGDALEYLASHGAEFDLIHASPPCQKFTALQNINRAQGRNVDHVDLIGVTRSLLRKTGKDYIIENVQGAPLYTQIILCGHSLGLKRLARHRHFESSLMIFAPACTHRRSTKHIIGVYGTRPDGHRVNQKKHRLVRTAKSLSEAHEIMGIDWMAWDEIKEAVPPAYTEWIGKQLIARLNGG
jgi:DNA (cytosine-5)-methyltransferase 1